ncbi:CYTH and CHAD domain-containing protein [Tindallia californiensis]|uniref:Inorganic triphosphatase YgiF, contains CYTH and CHAD domains n=1 Tax=Tindallia californiensis TaxID=159292 RepID=A0A1H3MWS6_9FIRM|nr:CYTH and CHAD domain-containing protein [Tindallia californiensis]SDY80943.1 Inorganic triphosphatase YgiF, contains CYTH and CHAD domains [Tindallia californiensis]
MEQFREIELKLSLINRDQTQSLLKELKSLTNKEKMVKEMLHSVYYDTKEKDLLRAGLAFRMRQEQGGWTATVKGMGSVKAGLHQRQEWNVTVKDEAPSIQIFSDIPELKKEMQKITKEEKLIPILRTSFTREKGVWEDHEGNQIEVALDIGEVKAGLEIESIHEVELELKKGKVESLFKLGKHLADRYPLTPEPTSKFLRGLNLLGFSDKEQSRKALQTPVVNMEEVSAWESFELLSRVALEKTSKALGKLLKDPKGIETLHQLRVSIRNLRSLLFLYKPLIEENQYKKINSLLRDWSRQTNELRELDVMLLNIGEWTDSLDNKKDAYPICKEVKKVLENQKENFTNMLLQGKMTPYLLEVSGTLECILDQSIEKKGKSKATAFIKKRMFQQIDGFMKEAKTVEINEKEALHRLRIKGKKLRYSLQNVMQGISLENKNEFKKVLKITKLLQDLLGTIHDSHCEMKRMREVTFGKLHSWTLMKTFGNYEGWHWKRIFQLEIALEEQWKKLRQTTI